MSPTRDPYAAPAYKPEPIIQVGPSAFTKWVYLSTLSLVAVFCFFAGGLVDVFDYYERTKIGSKLSWAVLGFPCAFRVIAVYRTPTKIAVFAKKWFPAILRFFAIILMTLAIFVMAMLLMMGCWRTTASYFNYHAVNVSIFQTIFRENLLNALLVYVGLPGCIVFEFSRLVEYLVQKIREWKNAAAGGDARPLSAGSASAPAANKR